jgi:hypothetical protein
LADQTDSTELMVVYHVDYHGEDEPSDDCHQYHRAVIDAPKDPKSENLAKHLVYGVPRSKHRPPIPSQPRHELLGMLLP